MLNDIFKTSSQLNEAKIHWHPLTSTEQTFQSYTLQFLQYFNPSLFQSYTHPILHWSNPTPFQSYTLRILYSSYPTLFQSYSFPILCVMRPKCCYMRLVWQTLYLLNFTRQSFTRGYSLSRLIKRRILTPQFKRLGHFFIDIVINRFPSLQYHNIKVLTTKHSENQQGNCNDINMSKYCVCASLGVRKIYDC